MLWFQSRKPFNRAAGSRDTPREPCGNRRAAKPAQGCYRRKARGSPRSAVQRRQLHVIDSFCRRFGACPLRAVVEHGFHRGALRSALHRAVHFPRRAHGLRGRGDGRDRARHARTLATRGRNRPQPGGGLASARRHLGGVFIAISQGVPAGISALIPGLQPILTSTIANRFMGEKVTLAQWFGLALGFVGVLLVLHDRSIVLAGSPLGWIASGVSLIGITLGALYQKRFCGAI